MDFICTKCNRETNDNRELGTVCLAQVPEGLCPGMIDSKAKVLADRKRIDRGLVCQRS